MSKRAENRETRRRVILTEARRLFAERGIEETRMEDIARAAGCTRRTLYAYFKSWDDLALHVTIEDLTHRWAVLSTAMESGQTGLDKLRFWGEAYYTYAKQYPQTLRTQVFWDYRGFHRERLDPESLPVHDNTLEPIVDGMRRVFAEGQADGSIAADLDPDTCLGQYAYTLRAVMHRVLFPAESFADFTPDPFVDHYINLFLRGIAGNREVQS